MIGFATFNVSKIGALKYELYVFMPMPYLEYIEILVAIPNESYVFQGCCSDQSDIVRSMYLKFSILQAGVRPQSPPMSEFIGPHLINFYQLSGESLGLESRVQETGLSWIR